MFENEIRLGQIVDGMSFCQKVWALTARIPEGKVTTYAQIARKLGSNGYRAVGMAMNPLKGSVREKLWRAIVTRGGAQVTYRNRAISSDEIAISGGGTAFSEFGGDNYSDSVFFAGRYAMRDDVDWFDVAAWLDDFRAWAVDAKYELELECGGDDSVVEWEATADVDAAWEGLPSERAD